MRYLCNIFYRAAWNADAV